MFSDEVVIKIKQDTSAINPISKPVVDPILKGFFGINDSELTATDRSRMDEINEYFGDVDEMEKIMALKDMRYRMGRPKLGTTELDHFHKYVRIRNSIKSNEMRLRAMEK